MRKKAKQSKVSLPVQQKSSSSREPEERNNDNDTGNDDTDVVHVCHFRRIEDREAEEDGGYCTQTHEKALQPGAHSGSVVTAALAFVSSGYPFFPLAV
jgi:hypothetical protein